MKKGKNSNCLTKKMKRGKKIVMKKRKNSNYLTKNEKRMQNKNRKGRKPRKIK